MSSRVSFHSVVEFASGSSAQFLRFECKAPLYIFQCSEFFPRRKGGGGDASGKVTLCVLHDASRKVDDVGVRLSVVFPEAGST